MPLHDWKCDRCGYKEIIFTKPDDRNPICIKCDKKMFVYILPVSLNPCIKPNEPFELYGLDTKGKKWR